MLTYQTSGDGVWGAFTDYSAKANQYVSVCMT